MNAASPATNATRGVDNRNNQEQVEVPTPEVGTWLVRVRGTNVPQGPQDFSLACEGCRALDVGVCTNTTAVDSTAGFLAMTAGPQSEEDATPGSETPQASVEAQAQTPGEAWQQALEAGLTPAEADQARQMAELEAAREAGPEALRALLGRLDGAALDLAQDELAALAADEPSPVLPDTPAVLPETEERYNRLAQDAPTAVVSPQNDPAEGAPGGAAEPDAVCQPGPGCRPYSRPRLHLCHHRRGGGCRQPGDRLRLAGNVTFAEHVTVSKNHDRRRRLQWLHQRLSAADDPTARPVGLSWISPRVRWH